MDNGARDEVFAPGSSRQDEGEEKSPVPRAIRHTCGAITVDRSGCFNLSSLNRRRGGGGRVISEPCNTEGMERTRRGKKERQAGHYRRQNASFHRESKAGRSCGRMRRIWSRSKSPRLTPYSGISKFPQERTLREI